MAISDKLSTLGMVLFTVISIAGQARAEAANEILHGDAVLEASALMVVQHAIDGTLSGKSENKVNFRSDIELSLPIGQFGNATGEFFAHARIGEGNGLENLVPTFTGAVNSTAFAQADGDLTARLAQAWYTLSIPVGAQAPGDDSLLMLTAGKLDGFVFFDQNDLADDESAAFLNNVFVHNPLLDSGGHLEADEYGFAPGLRVAYRQQRTEEEYWQASMAVFTPRDWGNPFFIGQLESGGKYLFGMEGVYRIYYWAGQNATPFGDEEDVSREHRRGWGLSVNQQVMDNLALFLRFGHTLKGRVQFDQALTIGTELGGAWWGRPDDRIGIAAGWLDTSGAFKKAAPTLDANDDGMPDFGYAPSGAEKNYEIYYSWQVNEHLAISPDYQRVTNPAGSSSSKNISVLGLRLKASF